MPEPRVVVTGIGAVTPFGLGVDTAWESLLRGDVAIKPVVRFDASRYRSEQAGEVRCADSLTKSDLALSSRFLEHAASEAADDAELTGDWGARAALYLGTVFGARPHLEHGGPQPERRLDEGCATLARRWNIGGPVAQLAMACASSNGAIAAGASAIRRGRADIAIVGGMEQLSETMFMMFSSMRALSPDAVRPFDRQRRGLILAEGAAILILESAEHAERRGATSYCELAAGSSVCDAYDMVAPEPSGEGAVRSMRSVLQRAELEPGDVDHVVAHGTGTPANDSSEALAIAEVLGSSASVSGIKSMLGHMQGAAGAIGAVAAVLSIRDGVIPPTPTLQDPEFDLDICTTAVARPIRVVVNNAYGFGGNVSSLLFQAP